MHRSRWEALGASGQAEETLIEDACRGVSLVAGDVERAVEEMRRAGVEVIKSQDVRER